MRPGKACGQGEDHPLGPAPLGQVVVDQGDAGRVGAARTARRSLSVSSVGSADQALARCRVVDLRAYAPWHADRRSGRRCPPTADPADTIRVVQFLFVCTANICRSPMAAALFAAQTGASPTRCRSRRQACSPRPGRRPMPSADEVLEVMAPYGIDLRGSPEPGADGADGGRCRPDHRHGPSPCARGGPSRSVVLAQGVHAQGAGPPGRPARARGSPARTSVRGSTRSTGTGPGRRSPTGRLPTRWPIPTVGPSTGTGRRRPSSASSSPG